MATKTSAERLETAARRVFTLNLRKSGATYVDIAERVIKTFGPERLPRGYDERYAYKDVARELERINRERADAADAVRALELERLDRMFLSTWPQVTAGHLGAIDRALRIMERRAKLLGLDAPQKVAPTTPGGSEPWDPAAWAAEEQRRLREVLAAEDPAEATECADPNA